MNKLKRACVVPVCYSERFDLVHKFPMEDSRTEAWLIAINSDELWKIPLSKLRNQYFVCTRHFRNEDYKNVISRSLNKTAVPCLNLTNLDDLNLVIHRSGPKISNSELNQQNSTSINIPESNIEFEENIRFKRKIIENKINEKAKMKCSSTDINLSTPAEKLLSNYNDSQKIVEREKALELEDLEKRLTLQELFDETSNTCNEFEGNQIEILNNSPKSDEVIEMPTLEIIHPDYTEKLNLNYFWLRDHCKCKICFNCDTNQRNCNILDISLDIKPIKTEVSNNQLNVYWDDNHQSNYDFDFLFNNAKSELTRNELFENIFWDRQKILNNEIQYAKIDFGNFLKDDNLAKEIVRSLIQYGFAFIENVPPSAEMTEMTIKRLFPIQKTFFGEMWTFSDKKDHADFAYTKKSLYAHTDNTYFNDAAGLITFHCIKHTGIGGETILVDGFKILNDLKKSNPNIFQSLCEINVPADYIEDEQHHKYSAPIIKLNSVTELPEQIRFNLYDRSDFNTLPQEDMQSFYKSLRELASLIQLPEYEYRFKLNPGTVIIFDNWRLLHGREKYDGTRVVTGCYITRTDFMSKARIFNLIS